ncbi:hypothetical protein [Arsenophonus nasoniae]|uniref:Uncharacterized protein n=1 Tax=Arsenophonus nasoniae TaxID=638 RepID=A0AA95H0A4_9GAMM|nr:hypothetical protein [Arsenophonus nasoniae]WGM03677.1 hypothetical protein QE210_19510 [Arsenophonus nasoniae]WGM08861.1 hypothetical protein QE258_26240 [Arsenophonus nasoniae]
MNTQNVKTAAQKPSERWVEKNKESIVIQHQKALFNALFQKKSGSETDQWLFEQLMAITENVLNHGVSNWQEPKLKYSVVKYWIKAITLVPDLYGELGEEIIAFVRNQFEQSLCVEVAMARQDYQF